MRRLTIVLMTGAALIASSCAPLGQLLGTEFRAESSDAVSGFRCPPLVRYEPEEIERARSEIPPGSVADRMIGDYYLMREMCR